jgi:hypothetical protein
VDAITLLAEPATPARHLDTGDGRFRLGVHIYDRDEDTCLHVRGYLRDLVGRPHFHVLLDRAAGVFTTAVAETDAAATVLIRQRMREAAIEPGTDERDMLADGPGVSRLADPAGHWALSVRASAYIPRDDEAETLLRVRLFARDFGHAELVLGSNGRVVSLTRRTRGERTRVENVLGSQRRLATHLGSGAMPMVAGSS